MSALVHFVDRDSTACEARDLLDLDKGYRRILRRGSRAPRGSNGAHEGRAACAADGEHVAASRRYRPRPAPLLVVREARAEPESVADWQLVHDRIVALGAERAAREHELCRWLRAAMRLGVHLRLGLASFAEYAERQLGLRARGLEERLRVARALDSLPSLDRAFARGELSWSAVRELSRVATAETEGAWQRWAEGKRAREVEQTVAARHPGQRPEARPDPALVKHRLRYEVRAETMALFRDLEARVRADLGQVSRGEVDDDMVLHEIARRALGGPEDEGRSSYQVAVTRCPACLRTSAVAGGHDHEIDAAVAEMVACDCQDVGEVGPFPDGARPHVGAGAGLGSELSEEEASSPHVGARALHADEGVQASHGGPHVGAGVGHGPGLSEGETSSPHVGAQSFGACGAPRPRATQSIPPAMRRAVWRRDRGRCSVPGCANHRWLDVHHVVPRAEGGGHDPENCCLVCGAHHRAVHLGRLVIEGTASRGFTFRHADGTVYGGPLRPAVVEAAREVLGALEHLGFPPSRARALVDEVMAGGPPEESSAFLRAALLRA